MSWTDKFTQNIILHYQQNVFSSFTLEFCFISFWNEFQPKCIKNKKILIRVYFNQKKSNQWLRYNLKYFKQMRVNYLKHVNKRH